jgi:serine/threonine protein kinase
MKDIVDQGKHLLTLGRGKNGVMVQGYLSEFQPKRAKSKDDACLYAVKMISFQETITTISDRSMNKECILGASNSQVENIIKEHEILSNIHSSSNAKYGRKLSRYSKFRYFIIESYGYYLKPLQSSLSSDSLSKTVQCGCYLSLEACLGGSLSQHILAAKLNPADHLFTLNQIRFYLTQLVNVLLFLFTKQIIHRDIKTSNVFVNAFGHIKLGDFDAAIQFARGNQRFQ